MLEKLVEDVPDHPAYRLGLARGQLNLGILLASIKQPERAEEALRRSSLLIEELVQEFPDVPEYKKVKSNGHTHFARVLGACGRLEEAEKAYRQALAWNEEHVERFPDDPDGQDNLAVCLGSFADLKSKSQGQPGEALELARRAIEHEKAALRANSLHPVYRRNLACEYCILAEAQLKKGDHAEAAATGEEIQNVDLPGWEAPYDAACFLSRCVPLAEGDRSLPQAERRGAAERYAARAMELLRQSIAKGFKDTEHLENDPDLVPLHHREDYQGLVQHLGGKN